MVLLPRVLVGFVALFFLIGAADILAVEIDRDGRILLSNGEYSVDELETKLKAIRKVRPSGLELYVKPHYLSSYGVVVEVVATGRAAGFDTKLLSNEPFVQGDSVQYAVRALHRCVRRKWSFPGESGAPITVKIQVKFESNGRLVGMPHVLNTESSVYFLAAVMAVRSSLLECTPLVNMPSQEYNKWKELTLEFDVKELGKGK